MDKSRDLTKLISKFKLDCSVEINNEEKRNFYRGYEYVDLGLPSRTLWATCNVGAESETDYGNYYKCGMGSKAYSNSDEPYRCTKEIPYIVDTAAQVWGGEWRMPTREQILELIDKTNYQWVVDYKCSGISGGLFTAFNGNSVFFPACGYKYGGQHFDGMSFCLYWASSLIFDEAFYLLLNSKGTVINYVSRNNGFSVRPVFNLK